MGILAANKLCGLVWDSYETIVEACKTAGHFLIDDPERIRSIGTREDDEFLTSLVAA